RPRSHRLPLWSETPASRVASYAPPCLRYSLAGIVMPRRNVMSRLLFRLVLSALCLGSIGLAAHHADSRQPASQAAPPVRIIAFGAHPDDAEQKAGGVAALWAAQGHKVKLVAMTNGDVGHFAMAGGPLAKRRKSEVAECGRIFGVESEVVDIHDGEL